MQLRARNRIGVLTSGGDAPGMNAALRAAARVGAALGLDMVGVEDGYRGLVDGRVRVLDLRELDEAARRGGSVLGTAREQRMRTDEGLASAAATIAAEKLRGLLVIGGNGSLTGARALEKMRIEVDGAHVAVAGVPASIDNDLACTSMAIGVDTAMNTIVQACDRICDTAASHRRTFILEVMGRDCGYLAMTSAVAAGADVVLVREVGKDDDALVEQVVRAMEASYRDHTKRRVLVVKAEGVKFDSVRLKEAVDARTKGVLPDVDTRVTVLGHTVRGGTPTAFDRLLAARLTNAAVRGLADGKSGFMAGYLGPAVKTAACEYDPHVALTPIDEVLAETARFMDGESDVARWRKKVFQEIEPILNR
jgi:6-phosphofructokinase 1